MNKGIQSIMICLIVSITYANAQVDSLALQSPEAITAKMLEFISCKKGEEINWDEYRNLFLPTAQKISINHKAPPHRQVRTLNLEEFVRYFGPQYPKEGFEEVVIGLEVNKFNDIAQVFQTFHCKTPNGSYEARGVNSYQLVYTQDRWWIASTMFTNETADNPLPNALLFEEYQSTEDK